MKKIEIKFLSNRQFFLIVVLLVIGVLIGYALGYGGSQPNIVGHTFGELQIGAEITNAHIAPNADINASKLLNASITGGKIANDTITGTQINEATLGTVPSATSASSATTATSASNSDTLDSYDSSAFFRKAACTIRSASLAYTSGTTGTVDACCLAGEYLMGGGHYFPGYATCGHIIAERSYPTGLVGTAGCWRVQAHDAVSPCTGTIYAYAICCAN